ncbi:MAG TPA: 2-oxoglutarate and iron-dependent oxygenase domain-containing protein [Candidatus Limnocylindrales bacterium]|nr:2-oxoglutarate and iron-dependent oxygenase domain-containing protein [Candidatus Limnocylindrales bacterium]
MSTLPVIDLSRPLDEVASEVEKACTASGFFYVRNHRVPKERFEELDGTARRFFALPEPEKMEIAMARAGKAWRGFFPVGAELTSGRPDLKEGLYFGAESDVDLPLHGRNLFPARIPELRPAVLSYMDAVEGVAHQVMRAVAVSLGLDSEYFHDTYTANPTILFRIFHYPPSAPGGDEDEWGVGEHTDYGLLTLLAQDDNGGLQVRTPQGWLDAPPLPDTFICNIGDMLDRLTGGYYRSTPHRVRNTSGNERLSFPFFFDPDFHREVPPLPRRARGVGPKGRGAGEIGLAGDGQARWDGQDLRAFEGTYGDYLVAKVAKVFPDLAR